jgi:hypothetical protein
VWPTGSTTATLSNRRQGVKLSFLLDRRSLHTSVKSFHNCELVSVTCPRHGSLALEQNYKYARPPVPHPLSSPMSPAVFRVCIHGFVSS